MRGKTPYLLLALALLLSLPPGPRVRALVPASGGTQVRGRTGPTGLAVPRGETRVFLDPDEATILNDNLDTQTFTVRVADVAGLYGYQFAVTFDPANLEATAAAFDNSFLSNPFASPPGWNATIDNASGQVRFARTRQNPDPGVSGSGPLATISLRGKSGASDGTYQIDFEQNILADIDATPLAHTTQHAALSLFGTGTLQGSVDLQGRSNESGGTVSILNTDGYADSQPITAADGSWSFSDIPAGEYQVTIEMPRYLDAQKGQDGGQTNGVTVAAGDTTTLNPVKLLGGDANDTTDGSTPNPGGGTGDIIDASDAAVIGGQFGLSGGGITDIRADITGDNKVNVLDLTLLGGSYFGTSPVPWP